MTPQNAEHNYCPAHIELVTHLAEMRTSLLNIEKGLTEDSGFKRGITTAFVGVFLSMILQVGTFGFLWGGLAKQVEVNTERWERYLDNGQTMQQDVQTLKEKSYGYGDIPVVVK